ncbi:hypothetical protein OX284_010510 [Flavobacterium sp. SUN046]|uniref:hypothetical protein n=1 Tax=Flavobacterium sp. SUN046 TaxID=3002440 RepID=UPI002DBD891B|nr:hypothetical protein [Flavobacterium sp. SUN046]MEC4049860.1 hypothetical protein [Flavobacterium sp. SUN046]
MSIKKEEMVPLADMVLASLERDQSQIMAENATFTVQYVDDFKTSNDEVRNIEQSDSLFVTQKGVTKQLYNEANKVIKEVKLLQIIFIAAGLNTSIVTRILKNITSRNIEGALIDIKAIGQIIIANLETLTAKGMKATTPAFLDAKFVLLTDLSNQQTQLMKDRKLLTDDNKANYRGLYRYIREVTTIGKIIYAGTAKADEYNIRKLVRHLHSPHHSSSTNTPSEQ